MDFNKTLSQLLETKVSDAISAYYLWSNSKINTEKEDGIPTDQRSYVDNPDAFERWVKEQSIPGNVAEKVKDIILSKD